MDAASDSKAAGLVEGREIGSLISGVFGFVFVWVNSAGLFPVVRASLLIIAGAALVAILVLSHRSYRRLHSADSAPTRTDTPPVDWKYWTIVAIEAVVLFGGIHLITAFGYPQVGVAWVSFVVGTHFFALGRIFRLPRFHVLAVLVTCCGVAGFGLAALGSSSAIAVVSGIIPGFVLFGFALWALALKRP